MAHSTFFLSYFYNQVLLVLPHVAYKSPQLIFNINTIINSYYDQGVTSLKLKTCILHFSSKFRNSKQQSPKIISRS